MCKTPTYYLILNSLAFAIGCVILQLTHSLSSFAYFALISSYNSSSGFCAALPSSVNGRQFNQDVLPDDVASVSKYSFAHTTQVFSVMLLI